MAQCLVRARWPPQPPHLVRVRVRVGARARLVLG